LISLDAEGTVVTPDFSHALWHEAIPALYGEKHGLDMETARESIISEYDKIGDQRLEWYDLDYWVGGLGLGPTQVVIDRCLDRIACYPETPEVLSLLGSRFPLVIASGTPIELLELLLRDIRPLFARVFSSVSHYRQLKNPAFYQAICGEMGVEPAEVIHVGDNWQYDFLNSAQAGINAYYLDRSGGDRESSIRDLSELTRLLLRSQ